jgi:endogenous inhibitor of DNA gyrase (YacG/DUF329 family)
MADLGRWLSGDYRIPSTPQSSPDATPGDDDIDDLPPDVPHRR